jgi:gamma-butyrobetaine dioxygenase
MLWDAATWRTAPPRTHQMRDCHDFAGPWADDLERYGICFFSGTTEADLDSLATSIGPLLNTEFGDHIVVRAEPGTSDLALTARDLSPHTDFSAHMHTAPLLQFILCLEQRATGGDSIQVDGFRIANELRRTHPECFDLLARTPLGFQQFYANSRYFFRRTRPIIELDRDGEVSGVFFAHSHASGWRLAPREVDDVYQAYNTFFAMTKDPAYQLRTRMQEGDCVAFRNGRILHGRTAFDPHSGRRTLVDVFVAYDYFDARRNYLRYADTYLSAIEPTGTH